MRRSSLSLTALLLLAACPGDDKDDTAGATDLAVCEPDHTDPVTINSLTVTGDTLEVAVSYGGGCETHTWQLCWDEAFMESAPVQVSLELGHDANGDSCEAYLSETLTFGLNTLRDAYLDAYGADGTIVIQLGGQSVEYVVASSISL